MHAELRQKWDPLSMPAKERWCANLSTQRYHISMRPYFSRTRQVNSKLGPQQNPDFLQTTIGKVDEVLGPINQVFFTIKPQEGIVAASFKAGDKFYIGGDKLLPLDKYVSKSSAQTRGMAKNANRFLPKPKAPSGAPKPKRAGGASRGAPMRGGRGAGRGGVRGAPRGRGADRGGRGGGRGASRGGGGFGAGRGRGSNPNFTRARGRGY